MTAFCLTKFQRVPSLMPFTFTGGPHLSDLEMSVSNILLIGLFCSNNKMVIFSGTENSSQQTCKIPYMYDVHMEGEWSQRGGGEGLKICHMSADSYGFKLQLMQSLQAVVSSSMSSHQPDTF